VARGTARAIGALSPYVAGKTGTTEDAVDGWFVGFTNDVTIAVWVGYDNGDGKRRSLGSNATGARVALPIFQPILESIWAQHIAPKTPLSGPSPEARRLIADIPIDYASGDRAANGAGGGFIEHFRREADGQIEDTQYQLVSRESAYAATGYQGNDNQWSWGNFFGGPSNGNGQPAGRAYYPNQGSQAPPQQQQPSRGIFGLFQPWTQQPQPQRGQGYYWGGRFN